MMDYEPEQMRCSAGRSGCELAFVKVATSDRRMEQTAVDSKTGQN